MSTAYDEKLKIDRDKIAVRKSVDLLLHLLHDFIPHIAFRDAERKLYEAFEKDGIELTSRIMRKEYQAWKDLTPLLPPS
jgi:hypothetical protein